VFTAVVLFSLLCQYSATATATATAARIWFPLLHSYNTPIEMCGLEYPTIQIMINVVVHLLLELSRRLIMKGTYYGYKIEYETVTQYEIVEEGKMRLL
jgi:hypothetical protein